MHCTAVKIIITIGTQHSDILWLNIRIQYIYIRIQGQIIELKIYIKIKNIDNTIRWFKYLRYMYKRPAVIKLRRSKEKPDDDDKYRYDYTIYKFNKIE